MGNRRDDLLASRFEVQSCGRSLEIIKDVGGSIAVADKHGVRDHDRHPRPRPCATGDGKLGASQCQPSVLGAARSADVAIVHNGQITDYYTWRERLERQGYRFLTENDSELIAVWVSDQIKQGLTMEQALKKSITSIDGVFTYMIARPRTASVLPRTALP